MCILLVFILHMDCTPRSTALQPQRLNLLTMHFFLLAQQYELIITWFPSLLSCNVIMNYFLIHTPLHSSASTKSKTTKHFYLLSLKQLWSPLTLDSFCPHTHTGWQDGNEWKGDFQNRSGTQSLHYPITHCHFFCFQDLHFRW